LANGAIAHPDMIQIRVDLEPNLPAMARPLIGLGHVCLDPALSGRRQRTLGRDEPVAGPSAPTACAATLVHQRITAYDRDAFW